MTDTTLYRLMLVVTQPADLDAWIGLARGLAGQSAEVLLRGIVTMPADVSLSEGTLHARQMRDAFEPMASSFSIAQDKAQVYVDYQPMTHVLEELRREVIDLLMIQWNGPLDLTGGLLTDQILLNVPCDVVLISRARWQDEGSVLLALRGGPNLSLGTQVAEALADHSAITLFHAAEASRKIPSFRAMLSSGSRIARTVTVIGDFQQSLLDEIIDHKAVIMGSSLYKGQSATITNSIIRSVYEQTTLPFILIQSRNPEDLAFHSPRSRLGRIETLSTRVDRWFAENTFHSEEFSDLNALLALKAKQGITIGLALPALNEAETVGTIIETLQAELVRKIPLLDEIVLIDSDSTDETVAIAESYGIPAYKHPEILPEVGSYRGKGEALWKSLAVLHSDIIIWIDTDITNIHPRFIYGLVGPLLRQPSIQYVKGFYQRPIKAGNQLQALGGGRVTELVARPLLNLFYPELSGIVQPLSGEYAGRRAALEMMPFFTGYGVETGLLIDLHDHFGLNAIAQVDLESRIHRNQPLASLSKMAFAIHQVFISRLESRYGVQLLEKANRTMKLIVQEPERLALEVAEIGDMERPPMLTIPAYLARTSLVGK